MKRATCIIAAVAAALAIAGCGNDATDGVGGATAPTVTATGEGEGPEIADEPEPLESDKSQESIDSVKIAYCEIDDEWYGTHIKGTVTNPNDVVSDVAANIEITNADGDRVDEAWVFEEALKPGQKAKFEVGGSDTKLRGKVACSVMSAEWVPTS